MDVEGMLIATAIEHVVDGTFEAEWKAMDADKKKELVVEGFYRGASALIGENTVNLLNCPEMTVGNLVSVDGEYGLLNMVSSLFNCASETYVSIYLVETYHCPRTHW
jgi:hypothetical protein